MPEGGEDATVKMLKMLLLTRPHESRTKRTTVIEDVTVKGDGMARDGQRIFVSRTTATSQ